MDILIQKVITGNATPEENILVQKWINDSLANKNLFEEQKKVWDLLENNNQVPDVDVNLAFEKFNKLKSQLLEEKNEKSFLIYKIAAIFILIIGFSVTYFLFNESTKIIEKQYSKNELNKEQTISAVDEVITDNIVNKSQKAKYRFQKRTDSVHIQEINFTDSSTALISDHGLLKILEQGPKQPRIASLSGAGLFDIKPSNQDFILETTDLKIKVQGTKFQINTETEGNKYVEISVEEGFMEVCEKENPSNKITISSKEKYIYDVQNHSFIKQDAKKLSKWNKFISKIFGKSH